MCRLPCIFCVFEENKVSSTVFRTSLTLRNSEIFEIYKLINLGKCWTYSILSSINTNPRLNYMLIANITTSFRHFKQTFCWLDFCMPAQRYTMDNITRLYSIFWCFIYFTRIRLWLSIFKSAINYFFLSLTILHWMMIIKWKENNHFLSTI